MTTRQVVLSAAVVIIALAGYQWVTKHDEAVHRRQSGQRAGITDEIVLERCSRSASDQTAVLEPIALANEHKLYEQTLADWQALQAAPRSKIDTSTYPATSLKELIGDDPVSVITLAPFDDGSRNPAVGRRGKVSGRLEYRAAHEENGVRFADGAELWTGADDQGVGWPYFADIEPLSLAERRFIKARCADDERSLIYTLQTLGGCPVEVYVSVGYVQAYRDGGALGFVLDGVEIEQPKPPKE